MFSVLTMGAGEGGVVGGKKERKGEGQEGQEVVWDW